MDQRHLAGVGNIYANEALFAAGIDPSKPARRLTPDDHRRLHSEIQRILASASKQAPRGSRVVMSGQVLTMNSSFVQMGVGLVFAIVPSSGLFSGNVAPPAGGHSLPFKGALLQKQKSAGGFFTGSTQSGRVTLRAPGS